jgi:hypothetical protein
MVYTLLIHDDRYSAPSLYLLTVDSDPQASALAHARLTESDHHRGVELWDGERLVLKLGACDGATELHAAKRPTT